MRYDNYMILMKFWTLRVVYGNKTLDYIIKLKLFA